MACTPPLADFSHARQPLKFRPYRPSRSPSSKHFKMTHFIHKPSLWRRSCGATLSVRGMSSEPALQNIEPEIKKRTRWQLHETMVLIAAKRKQDLKLAGRKSDLKTAGEKWQEVEIYCQQNGIERTAQQCRSKWERITAIYSKIKDWEERRSDNSSFWLMKPDERKAEGFHHGLDRETFRALDELYSKTSSKCLSNTTIHSSNDKEVEEHAKFDYTSLLHEVDGKQQLVHEAEVRDCSGDNSSMQQHIPTPELPKTQSEAPISSYHSTFWLVKSPHSKQKTFEDGLKRDEKVPDNDRSSAIANTIDDSLNNLRVEECSDLTSLDNLKRQVVMEEDEVRQQGGKEVYTRHGDRQDMCTVTESELSTASVNDSIGVGMSPFAEDPREATAVIQGIKEPKDENLVDCMEEVKSNQSEENVSVHDQYQVINMHYPTDYLPQVADMHHWDVHITKSTQDASKGEAVKAVVGEHGSSHAYFSMGYKEESSSLNTAGFQNPYADAEEKEINLNEKRERPYIVNQGSNLFYETDKEHEMAQPLAHNNKSEITKMTQELAAHDIKSDCPVICLDIQGSLIKSVDTQTSQGQESDTSSSVDTTEINTSIGSSLTLDVNPSIELLSTCTKKGDCIGQKEAEGSDMQERDPSASSGVQHKEQVAGVMESSSMHKGLNTACLENSFAVAEKRESNLNEKREKLRVLNQSTNLFLETDPRQELTQELSHNNKRETTELTQELARDIKSDCPVNCLDIQGSLINSVDTQMIRAQEPSSSSPVHTMEIITDVGRLSFESSSTCTDRGDHSDQKETESCDMQKQDLSASPKAQHKEDDAGMKGAVLDFENESLHKRLAKAGDTFKEINKNSEKVCEGPTAGSLSQPCKENIADTKQDMKVLQDGSENPVKFMEGNQDGNCNKDVRSHEYDDDVITSIQAGISKMIRNVLQTFGRFFRA